MKKAAKLKKCDRLEIGILKSKGYGVREIARAMQRNPATISRELRRVSVYDPTIANRHAYIRRWRAKHGWKKLDQNMELRSFVIEKLKEFWNPDEIAGWLKDNHKTYISKSAIYEWLYSARGQTCCKYLYSKRYGRKKHKPKAGRMIIPYRISIDTRPVSAANRSRYGHMEADTIVSGRSGSGAILSCVDRKSRYIRLEKLETMKPKETKEKLLSIKKEVVIKSITFDNGIENREHHLLGVSTYFCDPYSSWQKGSIENANKLVRRFLPKKTDLSLVSTEQMKYIERIINNKPRKILGYRSARELAEKFLLKEIS